ncbi:hypothetical protein [Pseudoclavibacter sp. VKM Ac-2867]|uniref:hypothetical protein n=1 Tax=Pseudoclavibacter sp. VKM Ac-2867 TaxID=2783829 RepID=UPI001E3517A9|nr:hypothetical protein [Pseudoclavibacter sp. VKM Ac-2867]
MLDCPHAAPSTRRHPPVSTERHTRGIRGIIMVEYRIELVGVPVADVDRSRAFYG